MTDPQGHPEVVQPGDDAADTVDVVLGPATRLLWREPDVVELGLGPSGVVVEGLAAQTVRALVGRDTAPRASPRDRAALSALHSAGFLWPRGSDADTRRTPHAARLGGELRALQARHGEAAAQVLRGRRGATVAVEGASRLAAQVAAVLAGAGVGRVVCTGTGRVRLAQCTPGGVTPRDEGQPFVDAARAVVGRAAPEADTAALAPHEHIDLVVLALEGPLPDDRRVALHADGTAHLPVAASPERGVVGPLVLPARTSCTRCADLTRRDLDPAWDALAVQLTTPGRYGSACSAALAATVGGVAALQALAFLDGEQPATLDGTLELLEPDWRVRRRSWQVHPDCGCAGGPRRPLRAAPPHRT